jgi:peptidoglycan hydrolase CwlO-like protein
MEEFLSKTQRLEAEIAGIQSQIMSYNYKLDSAKSEVERLTAVIDGLRSLLEPLQYKLSIMMS